MGFFTKTDSTEADLSSRRFMYSVYDSKGRYYMDPFLSRNDDDASRFFDGMINNPRTLFYQSPSDFTLMRIGSFDELTGVLTRESAFVSVANGVHFKKVVPAPGAFDTVADKKVQEEIMKLMSAVKEGEK